MTMLQLGYGWQPELFGRRLPFREQCLNVVGISADTTGAAAAAACCSGFCRGSGLGRRRLRLQWPVQGAWTGCQQAPHRGRP
jgi:hypothetical protein